MDRKRGITTREGIDEKGKEGGGGKN